MALLLTVPSSVSELVSAHNPLLWISAELVLPLDCHKAEAAKSLLHSPPPFRNPRHELLSLTGRGRNGGKGGEQRNLLCNPPHWGVSSEGGEGRLGGLPLHCPAELLSLPLSTKSHCLLSVKGGQEREPPALASPPLPALGSAPLGEAHAL